MRKREKNSKKHEKRAEDLLDKDVKVRVKEIDRLIPDFKNFPTVLKCSGYFGRPWRPC